MVALRFSCPFWQGLGQAGGAKEKPNRRVNTPHIQAGIWPWGPVRKYSCLVAKVALVIFSCGTLDKTDSIPGSRSLTPFPGLSIP